MARHTRRFVNGKWPVFFVPTNLDLSCFPSSQRDYVCFIVSLIHWRWVHWKADADGYVRLKYEYLTQVIPRQMWPVIRDRLLQLGVIEADLRFQPGVKSYGFALAPQFRVTKRITCTTPAICRKLAKIRRQQERKLGPVERWLRTYFLRLDFDIAAAQQRIAQLTPRPGTVLTTAAYRELTMESAARLAYGERDFIRDRFGRVQTNVTCLLRELRGCLSYDGESLTAVDVSASQPLLLAIIAATTGKGGRGGGGGTPSCNTTAVLSENVCGERVAGAIPNDLKQYISACQSGTFYELVGSPEADRDKLKRNVFRDIFYGRDNFPSEIRATFRKRFPTVSAVLRRLKHNDYRNAAHVMQRVESTLFIDSICSRIMRECPDVPAITVHDSVATIPEHVGYVRSVIVDEFGRLGVQPMLKEEGF